MGEVVRRQPRNIGLHTTKTTNLDLGNDMILIQRKGRRQTIHLVQNGWDTDSWDGTLDMHTCNATDAYWDPSQQGLKGQKDVTEGSEPSALH